MPVSRLLFLFSKHHPRQTFCLLQRFGLSKRIQSCGYTNHSRHSYKRQIPVMNVQEQVSSSRVPYAIPVAVLGFTGIALFLHINDERRVLTTGKGGKGGCDSTTIKGPIIGGPFTLIDTEKNIVTERNFLGNWVLLYFGYTSSPDVGPMQIQMLTKAIDTLESKYNTKVLPVFITLDPLRDTPSHLRAYLKEFDSRIVGITGPANAVRPMAQEYRVFFRKIEQEADGDYLVECSHHMYLMNPKMEVARCFGVEYNVEELSKAISNEINATQLT